MRRMFSATKRSCNSAGAVVTAGTPSGIGFLSVINANVALSCILSKVDDAVSPNVDQILRAMLSI